MTCYTFEGKTLTEELLYERIRQALQKDPNYKDLKYAIFNILDDVMQLITHAHDNYIGTNSIGGNKFLDLEHNVYQENGAVRKQHLSPAYDREARIANSIAALLSRPDIAGNIEAAREEVLAQMAEEDGISDFGELMHNLFSVAIKARINNLNQLGTSSTEFETALSDAKNKILTQGEYTDKEGRHHAALIDVVSSNIPGTNIDNIMTSIRNAVEHVEAQIFTNRNSATKYLSEYEIGSSELIGDIRDEAGNPIQTVRGIADLIVVNPDGTIEIIDFKVASRAYSEWYAAKQYHTDYQLGLYRQMLTSHGVDGRKVQLKTFPIYFPKGNVLNMQVENLQNRLSPSATGKVSHLDWDNGLFTKNLKNLVASKIIPLTYENLTLKDDVKEAIHNMLGAFATPENSKQKITKEDIVNSIWLSDFNGKTKYNVFHKITGEKITRDSKEELLEEIDDMLDELKDFRQTTIKSLVTEIKQYQVTNHDVTKADFTLLHADESSNLNVYNVLNGAFSKYCNSNWDIVDFPELLDLGIFVFKDKIHDQFEIVKVSDVDLRTEVNINGGSTILGKFISNNEAQRMTLIKPMAASIANIELIETLTALNLVADSFRNSKLANIQIINPDKAQREPVDLDNLLANFNYLTQKAGIDNKIKQEIKMASTWEIMMNSLETLLADKILDPTVQTIFKKLETDLHTIQDKIQTIESCMQKLEDSNSSLRHHTFSEKRTFETPEEKAYFILSLALLDLKDTPVRYDGLLTKWGLHVEEIIRILGTPFMSQYKGTLNNGYKAIGFLQGLDMGTPTTSASSNLSILFLTWDTAFQHIRQTTLAASDYVNKITEEFFKRNGVSNTSRAILNSSSVWERFIEKGPDGKFTKELKIIHPSSLSSKEDQLFLEQILWEMNKYIIPGITEELQSLHYTDKTKNLINSIEAVQEAKSSGKYYRLPLRRAAAFDRLRNIRNSGGVVRALKRYWQSFADAYDPRQLHVSTQTIIASEFGEVTEMYNQYKLSDRARQIILDKEGLYDFEIDLNLLAIDVAFLNKRKQLFDECLTHASAMATVFHYLGETSDADFREELESLDNETKIILKNETIIPKELQEVTKGIGALKKMNSLIVLGVRPLQFVKEITFGQFTNYSRAFALSGTGQKVSFKSIFEANKHVWGIQTAGWLKSFAGLDDLASFTLIQKINKTYGIANEDLNMISKNNSKSRTGLKHGLSKYLYIFNSMPDFFNRMTLFVAKMIDEGCFDAHSVNPETGNLEYDIKKDKRFGKLVALGLNASTSDEEYLKQKALFIALKTLFNKEGFKYKDGTPINPNDDKLYLPRAFTNKEKLALKEVSDLAYGFYDHEAKSLNDHKFFGFIFKQFMAFWTAKTTLWLRAPGSNTAQGKFVLMMDGDLPVFRKIIEDPNTHELTVELTTENPDGTLTPLLVWLGDYVEGLVYSIGYTLRDVFTLNWDDLINNPLRVGNLKLALHDILIGLILYSILKLIFTKGTNKMSAATPAERTLLRAMQDVGPQSILGLSMTPSFVSTVENLKLDIPDLFSEEPDVQAFFAKRFGAIRDITWEQH